MIPIASIAPRTAALVRLLTSRKTDRELSRETAICRSLLYEEAMASKVSLTSAAISTRFAVDVLYTCTVTASTPFMRS